MSFKFSDDYYTLTMHSPVSKEDLEQFRRHNLKIYFPSTFEFLNAHMGIRPGCFHGLLGTMGSGKSTLVKAIVMQTVEVCNAGILLTEEKPPMYQLEMSSNICDDALMENIVFLDDKNIAKITTGIEAYVHYLELCITENNLKVLFVDNITTSSFYGEHVPFSQQIKAINLLQEMMIRTSVPIFYVAHTKKEVTDNLPRLMTPEDIRGSNMLPMQSEYFYTMQKFEGKERQYNVIKICKKRFHKNASGFYQLVYDDGRYTKDIKVPFESVNNIFKERDRLGKT